MDTLQESALKTWQAGLGFLLDCNQVALDSHRRLRNLQSEVAGEYEEAVAGTTRSIRGASDLQTMMAAQTQLWQRETEHSFEYFRHLAELAEANRGAFQKIFDSAWTAFQTSFSGSLEDILKHSANPPVASQMLKGMLDWSNAAMQAATTVTQRVVETAEAATSTVSPITAEGAENKRRRAA